MKRAGMVLSGVLETIFPGRCLVCGRWLLGREHSGAPVCGDCASSLDPLGGCRCEMCGVPLVSERGTCLRCRQAGFAFSGHRSIFSYAGAVRRLITDLKFQNRTRLSTFFADFLAPRIIEAHPGVPVVPVPGREFPDSVELVARELTARHGITVLRLLRRSGGRAQKTLDLRERRQNLSGRIRLADGRAPAHAVLFDDVFTTGATADTCSRALLEAGCRAVWVVSIAMEE